MIIRDRPNYVDTKQTKRDIEDMTDKKKKKMGRPPSGIARRPMTISLPVVLADRIKQYTAEHGESGSNLIARLLAEFFRTDGRPPGNVRATLIAKLEQLE